MATPKNPDCVPETNETTLAWIAFPLGKVLAALVIIHFMIALVIPLLFLLDLREIPPKVAELGENVWSIWRCHPVLVAFCLFIAKRSPTEYRRLLIADIAVSVSQVVSVYILYSCYDSHLLL